MTWFKVDDGLYSHPKWLATSTAGRALWVTAGSWCASQLTDGFVPRHVLPLVGGRPRDAAELVTVGLWLVEGDGWRFHGWLEFQPSREKVEGDRAAARDRMAAARAAKRSPERSEDVRPNTNRSSGDVAVTRPDPTRPTTPPNPPPSGGSADAPPPEVHDGRHRNCRACGTNRRPPTIPPPARDPDRRPAVPDAAEVVALHRVPDDAVAPMPAHLRHRSTRRQGAAS